MQRLSSLFIIIHGEDDIVEQCFVTEKEAIYYLENMLPDNPRRRNVVNAFWTDDFAEYYHIEELSLCKIKEVDNATVK